MSKEEGRWLVFMGNFSMSLPVTYFTAKLSIIIITLQQL